MSWVLVSLGVVVADWIGFLLLFGGGFGYTGGCLGIHLHSLAFSCVGGCL